MPKVLRIEYAGTVIHDGPVDEFQLSENGDSIAVIGKVKSVKPAAANGLLEALTSVRRQQTAAIAEQKLRDLTDSAIATAEHQPEDTASD